VSAGIFDRHNPPHVKRELRHVELAHRCRTKLVFGQELWLIALHEFKKPVTAASSFLVGLFRELLLSVLHEGMPYVMQPGAPSKCTAVRLRQITKKAENQLN
jgi:hypothetical protein